MKGLEFRPKLFTMMKTYTKADFSTGMSSALYPYDKELQMKSGFGVIGLVAMISLVSIQLLGLYGNIKTYIKVRRSYKAIFTPDDSQVIHLPSSADSI